MKNLFFITPQNTRYGFALTGATQIQTVAGELPQTVEQLIKNQESGLLVVDERLLGKDHEQVIREIEKKWAGALIVLPSPEMTGEDEKDYAQQLITRAIGYHVRLHI